MKFFYSIFFSLFIISCYQKPTVDVTMRAKDYRGNLISGARVFFDKNHVGTTNEKGFWSGEYSGSENEKFRIEVTKDDPLKYYEPYVELIQIGEDLKQSVFINATFYSVPKKNSEIKKTKDLKKISQVKKEESFRNMKNKEIDRKKINSIAEKQKKIAPLLEEKNSNEESSEQVLLLPDVVVSEKENSKIKNLKKDKYSVIFVHTKFKTKKVEGVKVHIISSEKENLKLECQTNVRGRCMVRVPGESQKITIQLRKDGYQSQSHERIIAHQENLYFDLTEGHSVSVFSKMNVFGRSYDLPNTRVTMNGIQYGSTNDQGFISVPYKNMKDEIISIVMDNESGFPSRYEEDLVPSGHLNVTHYFQPKDFSKIHVVFNFDKTHFDFKKKSAKVIKDFFNESKGFIEVDSNLFKKKLAAQNLSFGDASNHGWENLSPNLRVDFVIKASSSIGDPQISVVDRFGRVVAATVISSSIHRDLNKILQMIPFEGVIQHESDFFEINLGSKHQSYQGRGFDVYGLQRDASGRNHQYKAIATGYVKKIYKDKSLVEIKSLMPRSHVEIGQRIRFHSGRTYVSVKNGEHKKFQFFIKNSTNESPVRGVNIYQGEKWIGTTKNNGKLTLPSKPSFKESFRFLKEGYETYTSNRFGDNKIVQIKMDKTKTWLSVESTPSKSGVYLEDKHLGVTPLKVPIQVGGGWVKLKIKAPNGYRDFDQVLEIDSNETLDLTGPRKVNLEVDYRGIAQGLLNLGKTEQALKKLESIPKDHSDYLLAWHDIGRIYWILLDKPAKASSAFHNVTKDLSVADFKDKRFISSHISEGVSLFEAAEKLSDEVAMPHYKKSFEVLDRVRPYIRFLAEEERKELSSMAVFYRLACMQKIWEKTQDSSLLYKLSTEWEDFISRDDYHEKYQKNAEVYAKKIHIERSRVGI
ncbi:MAG: PEGA domain-containing protein [Oligoflexales bacterium]